MRSKLLSVAVLAAAIPACTHAANQPLHTAKIADVIGVATMNADREIVLDLRSADCGIIAEARVSYKPGDGSYAEVLSHIGGLKPGQTKPVPAWPAEPCPDGRVPTGDR